MHETIHAFSSEGEASRGAQARLDALVGQVVARMESFSVPIFQTKSEAEAYEAANPGRLALWFDRGFDPTTQLFEDDFEIDKADLYGTELNGSIWEATTGTPFGINTVDMVMPVASGYATHSNATGAGASLDIGALEMDIEVDYDLSNSGAGSNRQVRIIGRGNMLYSSGDRSVMPVMAIVRETGVVQFEPYESSPGVFSQLQLGTGAPLTGRMRLTLLGDQARVYIDGTQVGPTQTLKSPQLVGTRAGFMVRNTGRVGLFRAQIAPPE